MDSSHLNLFFLIKPSLSHRLKKWGRGLLRKGGVYFASHPRFATQGWLFTYTPKQTSLVFVNKQEVDTGSRITGIWWTGDSRASENVQMASALSSFIMSGWQITYGIMEISKWKPYWSALRTNVKKVVSGSCGEGNAFLLNLIGPC